MGAACALAAAWVAVAAVPASATTTTITCSGSYSSALQTALSGVHDGDTIIIDGLCSGSYKLPDYPRNNFVGGFTLEGEPGTTSGFSGNTGGPTTGPLLGGYVEGNSATEPTTFENLVFENATTPGGSPDFGNSGLYVWLDRGALVLSGDTFHNNSDSDNTYPPEAIEPVGNGVGCMASDESITIENTVFSNDTLTQTNADNFGGGALYISPQCHLDPITLTGDRFTGDTVAASSTDGLGGGLEIDDQDSAPLSMTQRDDVFDSDSVTASGTAGDYGGGGEWLVGVNLTSTGDSFTNDKIPGTSGSKWSWGAGLGILNSNCYSGHALTSTLSDDVVAANTITDAGGDNAADAQGAGIYTGTCGAVGANSTLNLDDSTVTANAVSPDGSSAGAVAGIDGSGTDTLALVNTILDGDSGGAETGGFNTGAGSRSATYSDFCNGTAAYVGAGNICAAPLLVGGSDVHETASSPTIDRGSNTLVPSGLLSDFYGAPRELSAIINCTGLAGTVDIGAAEYAPTCPATLTLTGATQTNAKWTEGSAVATISRKHHRKRKRHHKPPPPPTGTTFNFSLNAQATVVLTFTKQTTGRMVRGACVAKTHRNRRKHACTMTSAAGSLSFTGQPGADAVSFDGVVSPTETLAPGTYTVTITATTAGKTSVPATLSFTVVKA